VARVRVRVTRVRKARVNFKVALELVLVLEAGYVKKSCLADTLNARAFFYMPQSYIPARCLGYHMFIDDSNLLHITLMSICVFM
jgi:hypothetical protein